MTSTNQPTNHCSGVHVANPEEPEGMEGERTNAEVDKNGDP
jgi:hypothetical protein